jgi:hypothetical protein
MSFQWNSVKIPITERIIDNANPGYIDLGGLTGNDSVCLMVSVVVAQYAGATNTTVMSVEQSYDDSVTWVALSNTVTITGAGTWVWKHDNAANGQLAPKVRLKIAPPAGDTVLLSKVLRSFLPSNTATPAMTTPGAGGVATEATLAAIEALLVAKFDTATSGLNTSIQATTTAVGTVNTSLNTQVDTKTSVLNTNIQATTTALNTQVDTKTSVLDTSIQATTTALNTQVDTKTSVLNTSIQATTTAITSLDKGAGITTAATLRNVPASDAPHLLAPRHEAVTTPLAGRLSDGVDFLTSLAVAAAQLTFATVTKALHVVSTVTGWDGTTHREIAVDTSGNLKTVPAAALTRVVANPPLKWDYGTSPLLANTWTQVIAATATKATLMDVFDSSGEPIEISFDAGVTVAFQFSPGGNSQVPYTIPAGSTVHIRSANAVSTVGTYFLLNLLT